MVKLVEVMWLWDRGQPLDSLPPDQLCSRKTGVSGRCLEGVWWCIYFQVCNNVKTIEKNTENLYIIDALA